MKRSRFHNVLSIETSCDETSVAWVSLRRGQVHIEQHLIASQIPIHRKTRGVVPEVAAREHVKVLPWMIREVVAGRKPETIAVTAGPGLMPSLLVGVESAKALAYGWGVPLIPVNHMEAHLLANWIGGETPALPTLCLIVSGGHTELIFMPRLGKYQKLGQTRDDAAGEAFDKVAAMLDLPYPGGPSVSKMAEGGHPKAISFTPPMLNHPSFDFSFSGLKTEVLYFVRDHPMCKGSKMMKNVCAAFQEAVVRVLIVKTMRAAQTFGAKSVLLAGGVAANRRLRGAMIDAVETQLEGVELHFPDLEYCTDNAAMIGAAALLAGKPAKSLLKVEADPNWEL